MIHLAQIQKAAENLKGVAVHTPLVKNENLSERFAAQVYLKREDLQPVRSYKSVSYTHLTLPTNREV